MTIKDLKPTVLWSYFYDITQIPRASKKEEKILAYLLDFAKKHNLEAKQDKAGNVLITKEATKGKKSFLQLSFSRMWTWCVRKTQVWSMISTTIPSKLM